MSKIKYDEDANAFYIKLSDKKIAKTKTLTKNVNIDLTKKNKIVGIEIMGSNTNTSELKCTKCETIFHVDKSIYFHDRENYVCPLCYFEK
jgi:uncharacterized protein YuzE